VRAELEKLPRPLSSTVAPVQQASLRRQWPERRLAQTPMPSFDNRLIQAIGSRPVQLLANNQTAGPPEGFVVDYTVVHCAENFSFMGDNTFLIEDEVELTGTTTAIGDGTSVSSSAPSTPCSPSMTISTAALSTSSPLPTTTRWAPLSKGARGNPSAGKAGRRLGAG